MYQNNNKLFATSFVKWAVEVKVKEIVLLLALDSSMRVDSQIDGY